MRDKRDMYALATCAFCSIGRFTPIAYHAICGGGATCVLPPQDMCSVVGSFIPLCQITPFQNKSRWPHFKIVQFPNNPIWGHLKWDFSPFVSNIVIWGQSLRHRKRVQHRQKIDCYLKCLDSYIANPITRTKTYFKCPQRTIFDTARKKVANLDTKPCCRHLFS